MYKVGIASAATVLLLSGAANAQLGQRDQTGAPTTSYMVDGIALGSRVKSDGPIIRDYKCSPSDQFDGLTWCQKTRRDGSVEASYSLAHAKNGTVSYVNRRQQPAVLDAREADRDIQGYARKFGGQPRITKMPHRAGTDALIATWGSVALEPLDPDGVKSLAEGKSPKRGLLIDFVGNFTRSAREGLPIYRIVGGAGFIWAGSFEPKARGTLRLVAVDASALQPRPEPGPPPTALQTEVQQPPRSEPSPRPPLETVLSARQPTENEPSAKPPPEEQPAAKLPPEVKMPSEVKPSPTLAEPPAPAVDARMEAEAAVTRLQAELSAAVEAKAQAEAAKAQAEGAKAQAELARAQAEKAAQEAKAQARADAEIARKKLDTARNDAAAAADELDRLRANGGQPPPVSYGKITLIWMSITGAVLFIVWAFSRMLASYRRASQAKKVHVGEVMTGEVMGPPQMELQGSTEASLDEDALVKRMAHTLGVEDLPSSDVGHHPSSEEALMHERRRQHVADPQSEPRLVARDDDDSVEVIYLPDRSSPVASAHAHDTSKSIAPATGDVEEIKSLQDVQATRSE
jgi:hypothetical protein